MEGLIATPAAGQQRFAARGIRLRRRDHLDTVDAAVCVEVKFPDSTKSDKGHARFARRCHDRIPIMNFGSSPYLQVGTAAASRAAQGSDFRERSANQIDRPNRVMIHYGASCRTIPSQDALVKSSVVGDVTIDICTHIDQPDQIMVPIRNAHALDGDREITVPGQLMRSPVIVVEPEQKAQGRDG